MKARYTNTENKAQPRTAGSLERGVRRKRELPCALKCPKCGSDDIHREFHEKGNNWSTVLSEVRERENALVVIDKWDGRAKRDCIIHHCRGCQYEWETEPLSSNGGDKLRGEL